MPIFTLAIFVRITVGAAVTLRRCCVHAKALGQHLPWVLFFSAEALERSARVLTFDKASRHERRLVIRRWFELKQILLVPGRSGTKAWQSAGAPSSMDSLYTIERGGQTSPLGRHKALGMSLSGSRMARLIQCLVRYRLLVTARTMSRIAVCTIPAINTSRQTHFQLVLFKNADKSCHSH